MFYKSALESKGGISTTTTTTDNWGRGDIHDAATCQRQITISAYVQYTVCAIVDQSCSSSTVKYNNNSKSPPWPSG